MVNFDEDNNIITEEQFRALLVGVAINEDIDASMTELGSLVEAANGQVLGKVTQNMVRPNGATLIGSGKVEEIKELAESMDVDTVVFNDELTGMQMRNLMDVIGVKVIDRTILILDIFARRATSRSGKLQVELAQLKYRLPRLTGFGKSLSRLGGGIGTRGPGEKKLETDRRHIERRIDDIKAELRGVAKTRETQREGRRKGNIPVVALVGYTNVGKSAIMNYMVAHYGKEDKLVDEENMLFATLDAKHRLIEPAGKNPFILVDTVGFVSRLSHHLIEAFKGTLEEAKFADLIISVEDISNPSNAFQKQVADEVLQTIGAGDKPKITVYNKTDIVKDKPIGNSLELTDDGRQGHNKRHEGIFISAKTGENMDVLMETIVDIIYGINVQQCLTIPYDAAQLASYLYDNADVLSMKYESDGIHMEVMMKKDQLEKVEAYVTV